MDRPEVFLAARTSVTIDSRIQSLVNVLREILTMVECMETMDRIKRVVGTDLIKLPGSLCHELAGRDPQHIQQLLDVALRSSLERLNRLESYL
jgi:hypothetical protein